MECAGMMLTVSSHQLKRTAMKNPSNFKIIAKLILLNVVLVALAILTSCGNNAGTDSEPSSKTGFVLKTPSVNFRQCTKDDIESADSIVSQKWDEDRSRWYGYSAFNGSR